RATSVEGEQFTQLSAEADVIFLATVADVRSQWADPDHRGIETFVSFGDVTVLFGSAADASPLRFSGGTVDDIREEGAGLPPFTAGERVLLFARRGRAVSPIIGFNQGYFRIVASSRGDVVLNAAGRAVLGVRNDVVEVGQLNDTQNAVALTTFLEWVRRDV